MLSEFELIERYFSRMNDKQGVALGIGDDCALLDLQPGKQLAVSSDMLVAGRHFLPDTDPVGLGHKALAVNLSDLAAMSARPLGFTLAIALPSIEESWIAGFTEGLFALADRYACPLIGGDTTRGPLNLCITVFGEVRPGHVPLRSGAQVGDDIWITGSLGDARLALAGLLGEQTLDADEALTAQMRLYRPQPRVEFGMALAPIARAAIDISDGLAGDLGHILKASQVGATLQLDALPLGPMLARRTQDLGWQYALTGGDDYELCFTTRPHDAETVRALAASMQLPVTRIGHITSAPGLRLMHDNEEVHTLSRQAYDHFRQP